LNIKDVLPRDAETTLKPVQGSMTGKSARVVVDNKGKTKKQTQPTT